MLSGFKDGMMISLPEGYRPVPTTQPYQYYDIGRTQDLFIKRASGYFFEVVKMSPVFAIPGPSLDPIRRPDEEEYPANIDRLRARFPELADLPIPVDHLHFLLIHKLHYERLIRQFRSCIPDAAFVLTERSPGSPWPTILQRAIDGRTLLELYEQPAPARERLLIAQQLHQYIGSPHVDWAFGNFVWSANSSTLSYVDSKPTLFRTERRNEENRRVLTKRFIRPYAKSILGNVPVPKRWWEFWRR